MNQTFITISFTMSTHEAFTLNDISDHELILNDTQLELKNLQDEILTS